MRTRRTPADETAQVNEEPEVTEGPRSVGEAIADAEEPLGPPMGPSRGGVVQARPLCPECNAPDGLHFDQCSSYPRDGQVTRPPRPAVEPPQGQPADVSPSGRLTGVTVKPPPPVCDECGGPEAYGRHFDHCSRYGEPAPARPPMQADEPAPAVKVGDPFERAVELELELRGLEVRRNLARNEAGQPGAARESALELLDRVSGDTPLPRPSDELMTAIVGGKADIARRLYAEGLERFAAAQVTQTFAEAVRERIEGLAPNPDPKAIGVAIRFETAAERAELIAELEADAARIEARIAEIRDELPRLRREAEERENLERAAAAQDEWHREQTLAGRSAT